MTPTPEGLLPCPFCGSDDVQEGMACHEWWVVCDTCGVSTKLADSQEQARARWNRRSPTAAANLARATPSLAPEGQDDMDPTEWDAAHTRCEKCDEPYQVVRPGKIQPSCCCDYIASLHERINELELRVADLRAKQPEVGLTDTSSPEGFETITIPPGSPVHPPTPEAHKESDHA